MHYLFNSDYCEGAHPAVLDALIQTNDEQTIGYGEDMYCQKAIKLIQEKIQQEASIFFLVGGTQTNLAFLSHILKPWQAAIAAETGHICVHETGAIEASGHKILTVKGENGKVTIPGIEAVLNAHTDHHMVEPKAVYLSHPTELGTLYTKKELTAISQFCQENHLYLYVDGARLAMALAAPDSDLSLSDIAKCCDAFYIGGTKCGALFGEALVITNPVLAESFEYTVKQRGALLAKGRLLGVQFETLFKNDLYIEIGRHANNMADKLRAAFSTSGFPFLIETTTNQIFVILPNTVIEKLQSDFGFQTWEVIDAKHTAVRFVTSYATPSEAIADFETALERAASC